jgi:hypothetical protein
MKSRKKRAGRRLDAINCKLTVIAHYVAEALLKRDQFLFSAIIFACVQA